MSKFIYFPSFSAGEYGDKLKKDFKFRNGMTCRFYSKEMEEKYRHPQVLITAGAHFKTDGYRDKLGLTEDNLVMGDSGGYQIASGAMKWDIKHRERIFRWLEENTDIAMNLDIPPRLKYQGQYGECLQISKENFKYFSDNQSGSTQFMNVIQGDDEHTYMNWYNEVKDFDFMGWGVGGCGGSLYRFMSGVLALLNGKEHLKPNNEYFHILGTSKIRDFLMLIQLQKSLEDIGSNVTVTTDSSNGNFGGTNGLINKIQAALDTQYYTAGNLYEKRVYIAIVNGDVRVTSGQHLSTSAIALTDTGDSLSLFDASAVGRIPAAGDLEDPVAARLPQDTILDRKSGISKPNTGAFFYDDGHGNIRGACSGTINYETGALDLQGCPPNAQFVVDANYGSAHSGGNNFTDSFSNCLSSVGARSCNSKLNATVEVIGLK